MNTLNGTGAALITPFNKDTSIDFESLEKLIEHNITNGLNYFVVLGTTAETATLTKEEKQMVIDFFIEKNKNRIPMVLGIGGNNTLEVSQLIENTDTSAFEAILSVSPYYNRPNQEGLYQHFKYIAERTSKKIILYNVPSRTGMNMLPETTLRLANEFKNLIAVKEAAPNFVQSTEIIKDKPQDFMVLSGDDEFGLPMTLAGGKGVISVIAQALTAPYTNMIELALNGNVSDAYKIHYSIMNITRAIYKEGNPAGIKALLHLMGLCKPHTRLPLVEATADLTKELDSELKKLKL